MTKEVKKRARQKYIVSISSDIFPLWPTNDTVSKTQSLDPLWISRRLGAAQRGLCLSRDGHGPSPAWERTPRPAVTQ